MLFQPQKGESLHNTYFIVTSKEKKLLFIKKIYIYIYKYNNIINNFYYLIITTYQNKYI